MSNYSGQVISYFKELSKVPRPSGKEGKIRDWLTAWARDHGISSETDDAGNLLWRVPGSTGHESAPTVVIQGHMDMVCEKTPDSSHNFDKDPIVMVEKDGWLTADGTTLGADNGIAIALAMDIIASKDVIHPPLEVLFTVDEETGLTGAMRLSDKILSGRTLLNVDSEDEGVFTVGCAGGANTELSFPCDRVPAPAEAQFYRLEVTGLKGGHSGVDIHVQKANANVLLARALFEVEASLIASLGGGNAHNAIPREASAVFSVDHSEADLRHTLTELQRKLRDEYRGIDEGITFNLSAADITMGDHVIAPSDTRRLVFLLLAMPDGVQRVTPGMPELVETSSNLATLRSNDDRVDVLTSQRSSSGSALAALRERIGAIATLAGAGLKVNSQYPAWEPDFESEILASCVETYKELFKREPVVETIHAGLECGVIGAKYPGMQMISFGPTIQNPHSPDERILIESIGQVREFMAGLLAKLA